MAEPSVRTLTAFTIGKNGDDRPVYTGWETWGIDPDTTLERIVEQAAAHEEAAVKAIDVREHDHDHPGRSPSCNEGRPERCLDIKEDATSGSRVYYFTLDVKERVRGRERDRLEFMKESPFKWLPRNFEVADKEFLTEFKIDKLHAAFEVNLDYLRASKLATRIRESAHPHVRRMRIPFYFNFVDPVLGFAPWMLTDHSESAALSVSHRSGRHDDDGPRTHGGVHPLPSSYLSVPI